MKNLIKKILRENEEEQEHDYSWFERIDPTSAEKEMNSGWDSCENEFGMDLSDLYNTIIKLDTSNMNLIKDIGVDLYRSADGVREDGYQEGFDNCTCRGCCDDYIEHSECEDKKQDAYDEGYSEGEESMNEEIDELNDEISELENIIEELESELNETSD